MDKNHRNQLLTYLEVLSNLMVREISRNAEYAMDCRSDIQIIQPIDFVIKMEKDYHSEL